MEWYVDVLIGFLSGMFLYPRIMRWAYAHNYIKSLPDMVRSKAKDTLKDMEKDPILREV